MMAAMNQRRLHQFFEISVILKGLHAAIECVGGIALFFVKPTMIGGLVSTWTQDELVEDPHDFIANHLLHLAESFSVAAAHFYAFYLLSHGIVKLLLVAGLLRGKLWAYPASLVAMSLFILYQLYRFLITHGIGLIVLTVFDIVVIALIWHEWRVVKAARHNASPRASSA